MELYNYVDWDVHEANAKRLPNPIIYTYLKDKTKIFKRKGITHCPISNRYGGVCITRRYQDAIHAKFTRPIYFQNRNSRSHDRTNAMRTKH